jgi:inorganic pyrophosphatase
LIALDYLELGADPPREVNVVIEIPKGSNVKSEIDVDTGIITVDRILPAAMAYPGNYGFIPRTESEDGDALDVLVLGSEPFVVGSVVAVNPIGVLMTQDQSGRDDKIIARVSQRVDPGSTSANDITKIDKSTLKMIEHFFEHHKDLEEGKFVKIIRWEGREAAWRVIKDAVERYANGSSELMAET